MKKLFLLLAVLPLFASCDLDGLMDDYFDEMTSLDPHIKNSIGYWAMDQDQTNEEAKALVAVHIEKPGFEAKKGDKLANEAITRYGEYLGKGLREQIYVQFSKDEKHVFFYEKDGLVIVNTEKLESHHTKLDGKLITIAEEENSNCFYVLSKNGTTYIVSIYEYPASKIGSFSFQADKASIYLKDNCFYVGRNDEITKLEIEK